MQMEKLKKKIECRGIEKREALKKTIKEREKKQKLSVAYFDVE